MIATGSGIAHPRWLDTFGGPPPLVKAASTLHDPQLDDALQVIGDQTAVSDKRLILSLIMYYVWLQLLFY